MKNPSFDDIREALNSATIEFLAGLRRDWANERMYAFLYELSCEGHSIFAAAATEEGLNRVAGEYLNKGWNAPGQDSFEALKTMLRWGSPEDGWYVNFEGDYFKTANELVTAAHATGVMRIFDDQLINIAMQSLRELEARRVFECYEPREEIVIGICYVGGDNSDEELLEWAKPVNSRAGFERLREGLQSRMRSFGQIKSPGRA